MNMMSQHSRETDSTNEGDLQKVIQVRAPGSPHRQLRHHHEVEEERKTRDEQVATLHQSVRSETGGGWRRSFTNASEQLRAFSPTFTRLQWSLVSVSLTHQHFEGIFSAVSLCDNNDRCLKRAVRFTKFSCSHFAHLLHFHSSFSLYSPCCVLHCFSSSSSSSSPLELFVF